MKKVLIISKNCPSCPEAKRKFIERYEDGIIINISDPKNKKIAKKLIDKYNVRHVPFELDVEDDEI